MRIYLSDIETLRRRCVDSLLQKIPECRRQRVLRFRRERDRQLCLAAGLLLSYVLAPFGLSEDSVVIGPHGKPAFPGKTLPRFSLSHSRDRVMCAVGKHELGCDVERIDPKRNVLQLAARCFAPEEQLALRSTEDPSERLALFYRYWTLKESFLKMLGTGFSLPPDSFCIRLSGEMITVRSENASACSDMLAAYDLGGLAFKEFSFDDAYCYAVCAASADITENLQAEWIDLSQI